MTKSFFSQAKKESRKRAAKYQGQLRFERERAMRGVRAGLLTVEYHPRPREVIHHAIVREL